MADFCGLAFLDRDRHVHPVARQLRHRRGDLDVVFAAVVVLAGELLGDLVQRQPVEGVALAQADVRQALEQVLGLDVLVAGERQFVDRRTLDHGDH